MAKTYYAGMEVAAQCGRCGAETEHRVLSITDGVPEQLVCSHCGAVHKFRVEHPVAVPRAVRSAAPRGQSAPSGINALMVKERAREVAQPYGQGVSWTEGMWLDHPSFGLGRVQQRSGRKITVRFQSGEKTLIVL